MSYNTTSFRIIGRISHLAGWQQAGYDPIFWKQDHPVRDSIVSNPARRGAFMW